MSSPLSKKQRKSRVTRSSEKNLPDRPGKNGGKLKTGNKGHDGTGTGRPPMAYKALISDILSGKKHQDQLRKILENAKHPAFPSVLGKVIIHELGIPKPSEGGEGGAPHLSIDL